MPGPAVVADQGDVAEVQRVEKAGDQVANPGCRQVGTGPHRGRVPGAIGFIASSVLCSA